MVWFGLTGAGVGPTGLAFCTSLPAALVACAVAGFAVGSLDSVIEPLILRATPPQLLGRVNAVISPMVQLASVASMALAGLLASTVLRHFHEVVAGITFGPYNTIFAAAGLLFFVAGIASIGPMRAVATAHPVLPQPVLPQPDIATEQAGEAAAH